MPQPRLSDFDYPLPPELIAQHPLPGRSDSRLLRVGPDRLRDLRVADLPGLLAPGDLLVLNDTRVIPARLLGRKASGGRIELMVERMVDAHRVLGMLRASHPPATGSRLDFDGSQATVVSRDGAFGEVEFDDPAMDVMARAGRVPLPPYIERDPGPDDRARYQTVYARSPGAVAAPTAGLHLDEALLARLRARDVATAFVTLHVGAGTFLPVRDEDLGRHTMHAERYAVPAATADAVANARARGARVVAVGTTSLRALEAAATGPDGCPAAGDGETDLFILPGYRFRVVDRLLTNFHLPRSTLLMLVSAFAGADTIRRAYAHAIAQRYRFFSYGDAMLLEREGPPR
jgi:S-adenosylmethionine:tRNA ribosyltransferase-isomerase